MFGPFQCLDLTDGYRSEQVSPTNSFHRQNHNYVCSHAVILERMPGPSPEFNALVIQIWQSFRIYFEAPYILRRNFFTNYIRRSHCFCSATRKNPLEQRIPNMTRNALSCRTCMWKLSSQSLSTSAHILIMCCTMSSTSLIAYSQRECV